MDLHAVGYLIRLDGITRPPLLAIRVGLLTDDGARVQALEELPEVDGARLGRLWADLPGDERHEFPAGRYAATVVDTGSRLVLSYVPGTRGPLKERGITVTQLTMQNLPTARSQLPGIPDLRNTTQLQRWLEGLE